VWSVDCEACGMDNEYVKRNQQVNLVVVVAAAVVEVTAVVSLEYHVQ